MYLIDYHTHSTCSHDGHVTMKEMAEAACAHGISELCFTDHSDILDGNGGRSPAYDWTPALKQFAEAREAMQGRMTLKLGVELGSALVDWDMAKSIVSQPELDFVIGSIHCWSEQAGGGDYYFGRYDTVEKCAHTLDDYFTQMEKLAICPEYYDVLGHIIYPTRYMERDGHKVSLEPYEGRIRAILRQVAERGCGMEINTYRGHTVEEYRSLLNWFKDTGGEVVTIGSDAHQIDHLAGHKEAYALLESCGFRYVATFEKRKLKMIKL